MDPLEHKHGTEIYQDWRTCTRRVFVFQCRANILQLLLARAEIAVKSQKKITTPEPCEHAACWMDPSVKQRRAISLRQRLLC